LTAYFLNNEALQQQQQQQIQFIDKYYLPLIKWLLIKTQAR